MPGFETRETWTPGLFLCVTLIGAAFTFNAYFPRRSPSILSIPSFFAGWLTSELATHHFAWQLLATIAFVWAGALSAWPGQLGLAITVVSWIALLALILQSNVSKESVAKALRELDTPLPDGQREAAVPGARRRLVMPFMLYDPAVRPTRDIRYADGAGKKHLLDIYTPREGVENAPVLLQIHGGGWMIGHKREQALPLMHHMAARGWVCVAANYRLSPRATFPDHLIDLKLALKWVRENIDQYGGNPSWVAATGGSAGGHLSSLLALTANDPEYQQGFEDCDTRVQACVPFYGVYDLANQFGHSHSEGFNQFFGRVILKQDFASDPEAFLKASPASRIHADAPPFFVVHGSLDGLAPVEEARSFVEKLRAVSRQPVGYAEIPGAQHAFEIFHSLRTRHVIRGVHAFLSHTWEQRQTTREADACTAVEMH